MNRLRDLREDNDLLQKDVAKYLNVTQNCYSKYENEVLDVPTTILKNLADFYNTTIDYLLYRTDERKPLPKSIVNEDNNSTK